MTTSNRIRTSAALALALALGTSSAPASAVPFNINSHGSLVPVFPKAQAPQQASEPNSPGNEQPTIVRITANGGFDWGDAGIGAAGGLALSMLGVGGTLVISQRRVRRSSNSTTITG